MMSDLAGLHPWFRDLFVEVAHFVPRLLSLGAIPGRGGSLSVVLPTTVEEEVDALLSSVGPSINFAEISSLGRIQRARTEFLFKSDNPSPALLHRMRSLAGRTLISTVAGGSVASLPLHFDARLCVVVIADDGESFRIAYGHEQYGNVPSKDFFCHLVAHAVNLESDDSPGESVVVHLHPQGVIELTRFPDLNTDDDFNATLYAQRMEMSEALPERVALLPYATPGSEEAASQLGPALAGHRVAVLMQHGVTVRGRDLEECISRVEYTESAAKAAIVERMAQKKSFKLSRLPKELAERDCSQPQGSVPMLVINKGNRPTLPPRRSGGGVTKEAITMKWALALIRTGFIVAVAAVIVMGFVGMRANINGLQAAGLVVAQVFFTGLGIVFGRKWQS
jgi:ribulose-5-phosphate 4-epimerase/fuculose-1-phosphate aldolase